MAAPAPLIVRHSPWQAALVCAVLVAAAGAWTWRALAALIASPAPTLGQWLMPLAGTTLTIALAAGSLPLLRRRPAILTLDASGLDFPEGYAAIVPWSHVIGARRVLGGIVVQVRDGGRFGRKGARSVLPGVGPADADTVHVRAGLLSASPRRILSAIAAHRQAQGRS